MKFSIITSVYNGSDNIREAIESVLSQTYENIEYIVIDGNSTDGTMDIIREYENHIDTIHSQADDGIYDGLNRGIAMATGDIIGFLHADDLYEHPEVIEKIVAVFNDEQVDAVYGDLVYVHKEDIGKISRHWESGKFSFRKLKRGWMPPHPAFFVKREVYEKHGVFDNTLKIAADYDFMLRVLTKHEHTAAYLPEILYRMRTGGASNRSLKNILQKSREDLKAIRKNRVGGINTLLMKNISKVPQFFRNRNLKKNTRKSRAK